jgi:hypothetical protein
MQEVGGSIPPGSTTIPAHGATGESAHVASTGSPLKLLRRAIAAERFILQKPRFVAIATATSAIQSQNNQRNPLMFGSNNAGAWQDLARFFGKRVTICAAANGAGHAMLSGGYRGSRK